MVCYHLIVGEIEAQGDRVFCPKNSQSGSLALKCVDSHNNRKPWGMASVELPGKGHPMCCCEGILQV